jgi:hypothetical protein
MNAKKMVIVAAATVFASAVASAVNATSTRIEGEKLDSGLGELPHYSEWAHYPHLRGITAMVNRVVGEKLDSGLGELPAYREWTHVRLPQHTAARDTQ